MRSSPKAKQQANLQQFLIPLLFAVSAVVIASLSELFRQNNNSENPSTQNDALQNFTQAVFSQVENHLSLTSFFSVIASQLLGSWFLGANAQAATVASAQYPALKVGAFSVASNASSVVINKNATRAFFVGDGIFCFRTIDFIAQKEISSYGPTTLLTNNCIGLSLNKDETKALVVDNKNGGVGVVDLSSPAPTLMGKLKGFNAYASAWSQNEQYAYAATNGDVTRILVIGLTDLSKPVLLNTVSLPWPGENPVTWYTKTIGFPAVGYLYSFSMQSSSLFFTRSIFPIAENPATNNQRMDSQLEIISFNMTDPINPQKMGAKYWGVTGGTNNWITGINQISRVGSHTMALPFTFVWSGYPSGTSIPGISLIDTSDPSSLKETRRFAAFEANSVDFLPDEKTAVVATDTGVAIINFDQLFPTDAPAVLAKWVVPGGCLNAKISADNRFVYVISKGGVVHTFLLQDLLTIPSAGTTIFPVFADRVDAVLKTQEVNAGRLLCLSGNPALKQVPCNISNTNTSWFSVNADDSFSVTPPESAVGVVTIGVNDQSAAFTVQVAPGVTTSTTTITSTTTATTAATTLMTTAMQSSVQSTSAMTSLSSSVAQQSTQQSTETAVLVPTTTAINPFQNITHAPGQTFAPEPGLEILTSGEKIKIISTAASLTMMMQLEKSSIGQFMTKANNLGPVVLTFDASLGRLTAVGSPDNLNAMLEKLRFSLDDEAYAKSAVLIAVSQNGESHWAFGSVILSEKFGSNAAPVLTNNNYTNFDVKLGSTFSAKLDLPLHFSDKDGDVLTAVVDGLPDSWQVRNNVLSGTSFVPANVSVSVRATDGYKRSSMATFYVVYRYIAPHVLKSISDVAIFPGVASTITIPLDTFSEGLKFTAQQLIGNRTFALPFGFEFDANRLTLSCLVAKNGNWTIVVTGSDAFDTSVAATFSVAAFEPLPKLTSNIPEITAYAQKSFSVVLPRCEHSYAGLTYSLNLANGSPLASLPWLRFDFDTRIFTGMPPINALNTQYKLEYSCKTTTTQGELSATQFNIVVPSNQPPVIGCEFPANLTAITSQNFAFKIPDCAFASPLNYTLTLTAVSDAGWLSIDGNRLTGTPDTAGVFNANVTATDPLGGSVTQQLPITVDFSNSDLFWYWVNKLGPILAAVPTAYTVYLLWTPLCNIFFTSCYRIEDPFDDMHHNHAIDPSKGEISVACYRQVDSSELDIVKRIAAPFAGMFSHHLFGQLTLVKFANGDDFPEWLKYNDETRVLSLLPEYISENAVPIVVQITTINGRIIQEFVIDPQRHKNTFDDTNVSRQNSVASQHSGSSQNASVRTVPVIISPDTLQRSALDRPLLETPVIAEQRMPEKPPEIPKAVIPENATPINHFGVRANPLTLFVSRKTDVAPRASSMLSLH